MPTTTTTHRCESCDTVTNEATGWIRIPSRSPRAGLNGFPTHIELCPDCILPQDLI